MENINNLYNEYNLLLESVKKETNSSRKEEMQRKLSSLEQQIKSELKLEHERGNVSPEFIKIYSEFDGTMDFENTNEEEKEIVEESGKEKPKYSLYSDKITSLLTGEEIDLTKMSRIEKIKTIYEHTGTEITIEDPEIIALCDKRCEQFLRGCNSSMYEKQYGENWREVVSKIYKESYLVTVHTCISNGLNEVDEKRDELIQEAEGVAKEKENTSVALEEIKKEADSLSKELLVSKEELEKIDNTLPVESINDQAKKLLVNGETNEISNLLDHYYEDKEDSLGVFKDPILAEKLNNKYKSDTGANHPMYDKHQYEVVSYMLSGNDQELSNSLTPKDVELLTLIKQKIEYENSKSNSSVEEKSM